MAQWPLNSIRNYESTGEGCFQIEAGRRSPMGEGVYRFSTRKGEDALMYALFDRYITEVQVFLLQLRIKCVTAYFHCDISFHL